MQIILCMHPYFEVLQILPITGQEVLNPESYSGSKYIKACASQNIKANNIAHDPFVLYKKQHFANMLEPILKSLHI